MVHGRDHTSEVDQFGVSGYVYKNVFLIFDRKTESLWYPFDDTKWTAVYGPRKGQTIPFIEEPRVMRLGDWRKKHPDTKVLLGSRSKIESGRRDQDH